MIRLYIDSHEVDLPENFTIEYTYNTIDVIEPAAIKNSFSKTISIPGTPTNDKIFGEIYRLDRNLIENPNSFHAVNFDPRKRVPFTITRYGGIIESGYIQMNAINIDKGKVTYDITCFSGLGDFFYNLMTTEEGNEMTLADLYYKWKPVYTPSQTSETLTKEEEANRYILNWTSNIISRSIDSLDIKDPGMESTYVTDDITVIPTYSGLYDDFESSKMLIDNYNKSWGYPEAKAPGAFGEDLPLIFKTAMQEYFPISKTNGEDTYSIYTYPEKSKHEWMVTEVERDMEPFEARDLRVTKMNIGMKLSKLMRTISNPENNGGYTVNWHEDITNSPYWKYSWIMLDKPDFEIDEQTAGQSSVNAGTLSGNNKEFVKWDNVPNSTNTYEKPVLKFYYQPTVHTAVEGDTNLFYFDRNSVNKISMYTYYSSGSDEWYKWGGLFGIWRIYDGNNYITQFHTFNYFGQYNNFGCNANGERIVDFNTAFTYIKEALSMSQANFNKNAQYFVSDSNKQAETIVINKSEYSTGYDTAHFTSDMESRFDQLDILFNLPNNISNLRIEVENIMVGYVYSLTTKQPTAIIGNQSTGGNNLAGYLYNVFYSNVYNSNYFSYPIYDVDVKLLLNTNKINSVVEEASKSESVVARANKRILFGGSESPYKYLTDFTKLLNLKYIFDKPHKTISIVPKNVFYKNEIVDLSEKIDRSKQITIDPVLSETKFMEFKLETPETYPSRLYNTKNNILYSAFKYYTGYDFNNDAKNVFDGSIFKELIPYQLSSNFFHNSTYSSLLTIFNVVSHTNTLFKLIEGQPNIEEKDDQLYNFYSPIGQKIFAIAPDTVPKLACFDRDDNNMPECQNSFVFLNGFYKNFDYNIFNPSDMSMANYAIFPKIGFSDAVPIMEEAAGGECYVWSFSWGDDRTTDDETTYLYGPYTSHNFYLPYFSKYIYNTYDEAEQTWNGERNILASWHINPPTQMMADGKDIPFVKKRNPLYTRVSEPYLSVVDTNIYKTNANDYLASLNYIYPKFWKTELEDLYDKNGKQVTLYANIETEPEDAVRKFYYFDGAYWMITKIENYNITNNDNIFNKVTFVKVKNIQSYTNG